MHKLLLFLGCLAISLLTIVPGPAPSVEPESVVLADQGKALLPVIHSDRATASARASARTLADYLGRISGTKFTVQTGDGRRGIAVGGAEDFPELRLTVPWDGKDATRREDYLLRSRPEGLLLI